MAGALCPVCGRRLAKRRCVSRDEDICPRCCGITRSKTVCPEDCGFSAGSQGRRSTLGVADFLAVPKEPSSLFFSKMGSNSNRSSEVPREPRRLDMPDPEIEEIVRCTILMGDERLPREERAVYSRRCFEAEMRNRIVVVEGRDEDDNPCIFLHPGHVYRNGFIDSRLYRPGDDFALEVSWIGRGHIQVRRIDGDFKIVEVRRIKTDHRDVLEDDGSWW